MANPMNSPPFVPSQPTFNPDDYIGALLKQCQVLAEYLSTRPALEVNGKSCVQHINHMAHLLDGLQTAQAHMAAQMPSQSVEQPGRPN